MYHLAPKAFLQYCSNLVPNGVHLLGERSSRSPISSIVLHFSINPSLLGPVCLMISSPLRQNTNSGSAFTRQCLAILGATSLSILIISTCWQFSASSRICSSVIRQQGFHLAVKQTMTKGNLLLARQCDINGSSLKCLMAVKEQRMVPTLNLFSICGYYYERQNKMREISLQSITHLPVELPKSVHQIAALLAHFRAAQLQLPQTINFRRLGCIRRGCRNFLQQQNVATLVGLIGDAFLKDFSDDGLHECLFEDNDSHELLGKSVLGRHTLFLVTVFPLPKKLKIEPEEVGYELICHSFGNVGVLHIRAFALLFNDLFPELTESIHGVILQQNLGDRLGCPFSVVENGTQSFYQLSLDVVATKHEILVADSALDLVDYGLSQLRGQAEEVLEEGE